MNIQGPGRWEVLLHGPADELDEIKARFSAGRLFVTSDQTSSEFLLCADSFEALAEPESVLDAARELIDLLIASAELTLGRKYRVRVAGIARRLPNSTRQVYQFVSEVLTTRLTEHVRIVSFVDGKEVGLVERPAQRNTILETLTLAGRDEIAKDILVAWARSADDWPSLYMVHEKIEAALGGQHKVPTALFGGKDDMTKLFKHSAQPYRHGSTKWGHPPPNPMSFEEARNYVLSAVQAFINERLEKGDMTRDDQI